MPYPEGMRTYTVEAYDVVAFDVAAPEAVDVLGTYETFIEAVRSRDAFAALFTYDVIRVSAPYPLTYPAETNPFGSKVLT